MAEDQGGHGGAVDAPLAVEDPGAEPVDEGLVGRPPRGHHLAGDHIGIDQPGPVGDQQVGHRGLARPDAAGEPDCQHAADTSPRPRRVTLRTPWACPGTGIDPRYPAGPADP